MYRTAILAVALSLVFVGVSSGQAWMDELGLGVSVGVMQPTGGDQEYEDSGLTIGLRAKKPLTENVSIMVDYHHGETASEEPPTVAIQQDRFSSWGPADYYKTNWNYFGLQSIFAFGGDGAFVPYVSAGFGMTVWEVQDWQDQGNVPEGYDTDGRGGQLLHGTNITASVGAGFEYFFSERVSLDIGGRYALLLDSDLDNVGFSHANGPDFVDANDAMIEGSLALMFYFGAGDCDEDGIFGSQDKCPREKEDHDGFEDEDGCPDPDNDGDGILDVDDKCPNDAEDFDGFEDEDGCPDVDRDGDGIMDMDDACPDEPEDFDGFEDADGCPDPDNDGDGVLDINDKCPGTPRGTIVDATGCPRPEPKPELLAVMVNFDFDKSVVKGEAMAKLDALYEMMVEDPTIVIDIGGHASIEGAEDYNQALSERRAKAVMDYLAAKGISESRMTMRGYGEMQPLVPNDSEANRSMNRRAMITPTRS
ncbi:MAG: OmpA family protein [Candidatus Eisenbacteria bacterium]|nr:OmpA family protein [Candidatus Eisenbacteria bacterium]